MLPFVVGIASVVALSGCSLQPYPEIPRDAPSGGQTQDQLSATLATIEGLVVTNASGSEPNVKGNTGYGFDLELQPGYRIADPAALIEFFVTSAWSVRDGWMPNTLVDIRLIGDPSDPIDLTAVGQQAGWVPASTTALGMADNGYTDVQVFVDTGTDFAKSNGGEKNRERLGRWPGPAPAVPAGMIVPTSPDGQ